MLFSVLCTLELSKKIHYFKKFILFSIGDYYLTILQWFLPYINTDQPYINIYMSPPS